MKSIPILNSSNERINHVIGSVSVINGRLIFVLMGAYTKVQIFGMIGNADIKVLKMAEQNGIEYIQQFQVMKWVL